MQHLTAQPYIDPTTPAHRWLPLALAVLLACTPGSGLAQSEPAGPDWARAQELFQKKRRGETLTDDEQATLARVLKALNGTPSKAPQAPESAPKNQPA